MKPIDSGKYNRQITIEQLTETQSSTGGLVESWATFDTPWVEYRPMTGREYFKSGAITAEFDTLFTMPWRGDITKKMRVNYGGNLYNIRSTREVGYKQELEIMAQVVRA